MERTEVDRSGWDDSLVSEFEEAWKGRHQKIRLGNVEKPSPSKTLQANPYTNLSDNFAKNFLCKHAVCPTADEWPFNVSGKIGKLKI